MEGGRGRGEDGEGERGDGGVGEEGEGANLRHRPPLDPALLSLSTGDASRIILASVNPHPPEPSLPFPFTPSHSLTGFSFNSTTASSVKSMCSTSISTTVT